MSRTSPVKVINKGSFKRTDKYLNDLLDRRFLKTLQEYGEMGVLALQQATPVRTGKTAASWRYRIEEYENSISLIWENTNVSQAGENIVKLLVKGHGTRNGSYVRGRNFVTPAIQPIFDKISADLLKEVK